MSETAPSRPRPWSTTGVVAASFLLAAAVLWLLVMLSQPVGVDARVFDLDRRVRRIETLRTAAPLRAYPRGVVCMETPIREAGRLKSDLERLAHQAAAPLVQVSAEPLLPTLDAHLAPVQFSLEINTGYAGVLDLLRRLSTYTPAVLVDRADIVSKAGFVSFHLTGRVLCRA